MAIARDLDRRIIALAVPALGSLIIVLTVVYGLLLLWVGGGKQQGLFILNTVVASFVILILYTYACDRL